jgi:hypothetical protein
MTSQERNDLLIRVDERTEQLVKWTDEHIKLHDRLSAAFTAAVVSALLGLGTTVVSLLALLTRHSGG